MTRAGVGSGRSPTAFGPGAAGPVVFEQEEASMRELWSFATLLLVTVSVSAAEGGTRLLRFPDVWGDEVVFCYGGDL